MSRKRGREIDLPGRGYLTAVQRLGIAIDWVGRFQAQRDQFQGLHRLVLLLLQNPCCEVIAPKQTILDLLTPKETSKNAALWLSHGNIKHWLNLRTAGELLMHATLFPYLSWIACFSFNPTAVLPLAGTCSAKEVVWEGKGRCAD